MNDIDEIFINLKELYNLKLARFYKGCDYLCANPEQWEKYYPEVEKLKKDLDKISTELNITDEEQLLNGIRTEE